MPSDDEVRVVISADVVVMMLVVSVVVVVLLTGSRTQVVVHVSLLRNWLAGFAERQLI